MSLRIRRGTDAQRQAVLFDQGEIIYTTDTQKLYVGDGSTTGGNNVGAALAGTGLVWNALSQTLQATTGGGLSAVVGDTAPQLGGNLTLNGHNISGTGSVNITGSITATGSIIATTGLGADLPLNGYNIVGSAGTINITGSITGGRITGTSLVSGNLTVNSNSIVVTSGPLYIENSNQEILAFRGVNVDGNVNNTPQVNLYSSRGTPGTPTSSQLGDAVMSLNFGGYNGSNYQQTGAIFNIYSSTANMSDSSPGSELWLVSNDNNGGENLAKFNMDGVFDAPILKTGAYNGSGSYPVRPVAGMIIFDSSNQHFYGYNGSIWKQLDN